MTQNEKAMFLSPIPAASRSDNERAILGHLLSSDRPMNRASLARATGLTLQSVSRIVDALTERGLVGRGQRMEREGPGSPSHAIEVNGAGAFSIGLSITTDSVSAALMDLRGMILGSLWAKQHPVTQDAILETSERLVNALLAEHVADRSKVIAAGLVMTGYFVDERRVNPPEALAELALVDLPALFGERFGLPVILENDGTAAATAEAFLGVGRNCPSFGYLHFATGIGGGLVLDGQTVRGWRGNAGEVAGVLPPDMLDDRPTLDLLLRMVRDDGVDCATIADMLERFDDGWPAIDRWIETVLPGLNAIVSAIASIFDPAVIVLGGRIPTSLAIRLAPRIQRFGRPRFGVVPPTPQICPAQITGDAALIGGAAIPLRKYFFPR